MSSFPRNIKDLIWFVIDSIYHFIFSSDPKIYSDVIIVRLDVVGDFILWLDAAREIRNMYRDQSITLICNQAVVDLAKTVKLFDEIIPVKPKQFIDNFSYRFNKLKFFSSLQTDLLINPLFSRQYYFLSVETIIRFIHAKQIIGFESEISDVWQVKLSSRRYTQLIAVQEDFGMELIRNAEFVRALGASTFKAGVPLIDSTEISKIAIDESYYVLFPGAGAAYRRWPSENFASIADYIYGKTGMTGLICGGPDEFPLAEHIINASSASLQNWMGKTQSLNDLISLISGALFLVSNETSAIHIAAATHTESICILGGGHFRRFIPYQMEKEAVTPLPRCVYHEMSCFNCQWNCIYDITPGKPVPCISHIPVAMVLNEVDKVLTNIKISNKGQYN